MVKKSQSHNHYYDVWIFGAYEARYKVTFCIILGYTYTQIRAFNIVIIIDIYIYIYIYDQTD